jgi:hypothetical protein
MNSVVLKIRRSFFAMLLVKQQIHNRSSLLAPLVRKSALNNFLSFMVDRDKLSHDVLNPTHVPL